MRSDDLTEHQMHSEWPGARVTAQAIRDTRPVRASGGGGHDGSRTPRPCSSKPEGCRVEDDTEIFIYPGFQFGVIDTMVTNFHLPESTLIMLVSAFAGKDRVLAAYAEAVREEYRFFSYGDAMFLERHDG